jgi:hypothetical protein
MIPLSRIALGIACVVITKHPLSSPTTAQPDPELVGTWHERGNTDELDIFSIKNAHWMHLEIRKAHQPAENHDFFVSVVDNERYMNIPDVVKEMPGYTIVRYRTIAGRGIMTTWGIDQDKAAKCVRAGLLEGRVSTNSPTNSKPAHPDVDVTLSGNSKSLADFIQQRGISVLFSDKGSTLCRIR